MKCEKCWFCTRIGAGIYTPYPLKYCKRTGEYKMPFLILDDKGKARQLDLRKMSDLKIWRETGCDIHPKTVEKAKNDFIRKMEQEG